MATASDRITRALNRADDPDALLAEAFAAAARRVDVAQQLEVIRSEFAGVGPKVALDILGKIALAVVHRG